MVCETSVKKPVNLRREYPAQARWLRVVFLALVVIPWGCVRTTPLLPDIPVDMGVTVRVVTREELSSQSGRDPDLSVVNCLEILARLNGKAAYYIEEDVGKGRKLKAPNDFRSYKSWSPLPGRIGRIAQIPRFIIVVKDIAFLGWYANGSLVQDTLICIGKEWGWTKAGMYRVKQKDENHVSHSYKDASGRPALMPWALRIYENVWIHAGDIRDRNCSHGCINLPVMAAIELFRWAKPGTTVLIVNSMDDLEAALDKNPTPSTGAANR